MNSLLWQRQKIDSVTNLILFSAEVQQKLYPHITKNGDNVEGNSADSEVFKVDQIEESEIVDQGSAEYVSFLFSSNFG